MTRSANAPPRLAVWLLECLAGDDATAALLGDLLERYPNERDARGARCARWWFWREALSAARHFGARAVLRRSHHQETAMRSFVADVRYAARVLGRAPAFTSLVTVTLALAIGATAAIYSIVAPVLVRPLPYGRPDRLVILSERDANGAHDNLGYATINDVRTQARTLASVAAFGGWSATLGVPGEPEQLLGQRVSWNYFDVLGVKLAHGRGFTRDDDRPDRNSVVVLSYGLWQRRFGADPSIVGRTIPLDDRSYRVAGVAPRGFDNVLFPGAQIWRVLGYSLALPYACRTCRHLQAIARLRDGVSLQQAAAELNAISARLARAYPTEYATPGMFVDELQQLVTEPMRPALLAILSAAILVLLIAAANVVNLQIARAIRRDGELAIRLALGAGRARLAQQLGAEALLIALLGGAAGLAVARAALPLLVSRLPADVPRLSAMHLDLSALGVVTAIVVALTVLVGLAPVATRRTRDVFGGVLRGAARVGDASHHRARRILVVGEVALALVLLAGAALVGRSLVRLLDVDMGFQPRHLLTLRIQSTGSAYRADSSVYAYHARVVAAVQRLPGVVGAGTANQLPLTGDLDTYGVQSADRPLANPAQAPFADRYTVTDGFMRTMGIGVLEGRGFDAADVADSAPRVVVVSRSLAARLWPGEDPLGKRITAGNSTMRTVVGVAADVRHHGLDAQQALQFYVPDREWNSADDHVALVVRTAGDPAGVAAAVRAAVAAVDPAQPVTGVSTMDDIVSASTARRQLALTLFAAFAGLALVLAAAGIYGVLAGSVAERTREIGLRSALGATPRDLLSIVLRAGLTMAAGGILAGLVGVAALARFIHSLLFGIGDADPLSLAGAAVMLLLVAVVACVVPALRAIRVDPMVALRGD